ncbi:homodimeric dihydroxyacetone kinase [Hoeflea marina]|uniref:Homodimeric dihydroxyacetone kinase n=1 Tax=Hoeflea marina TaxID=274592 RepID=A0A317PL85_9HYPH|nr:dihydroxyacetone kinase family protein [Hoeflea marina]PWV98813.1 homodimeric dihydroxyacetone kinase [Hoeflea marina]
MKKLINDPRFAVREMLEGALALAPSLALLAEENVVIRNDLPDAPQRRVAVISGGGAGHEPAHAGYVGPGMLSAAVVGDVFTSPSVDAVLAAVRAVSGPAGALLVVKNYTGDRLNFGLAAEIAREEGIPVEIVIVADDAALASLVAPERRRGIAGTVFIHKLAGAAAERGAPLADIASLARSASSDLRTMGVGLGTCIVPAVGLPSFSLGAEEIEFGLGIHGEKGVRRSAIKPANEIVEEILAVLTGEITPSADKRLAVLVNGLGATPPMELAIVLGHALKSLGGMGFSVSRAWCGNFMTALEMPGVSITLLPLDDRRLQLLDDATPVSAWQGDGQVRLPITIVPGAAAHVDQGVPVPRGPQSDLLRAGALAVADALDGAEAELGDLDGKAGDGDLGASMARGAAAIRNLADRSFATPETLLADLSAGVRRAIAGSSGPFYAAALLRAAGQLRGLDCATEAQWRTAFLAAAQAISDLGGAGRGDRTMLDALLPGHEAWQQATDQGQNPVAAFFAAAAAAHAGAMASATLMPRAGRASYIGDRAIGIPDGGAVAVAIWMKAIAGVLE